MIYLYTFRLYIINKTQMKLLSIHPSEHSDKKYVATFQLDNGHTKEVHFGAKGYSDYTIHKDPERKERYLMRHKNREHWNDPVSPGALSRWILWNKPNLQDSIRDFRLRYNL